MTPADTGFDNQFERFEEQLRAIVKDASLQPRLVEDLHGSEDVQSLLSRHLDYESSERRAIYFRLQSIESALKRRRLGEIRPGDRGRKIPQGPDCKLESPQRTGPERGTQKLNRGSDKTDKFCPQ